MLDFIELVVPERKRTYTYADGACLEFADVVRVCVRPSGTHRLETADGGKHIVPAGWLAMTLDVDEWTF